MGMASLGNKKATMTRREGTMRNDLSMCLGAAVKSLLIHATFTVYFISKKRVSEFQERRNMIVALFSTAARVLVWRMDWSRALAENKCPYCNNDLDT